VYGLVVELDIEGKVAVVSGASRGIGRAVVEELIDEGVRVVAGARDVTQLAELPGVIGVAGDLAQPNGSEALVNAAVDAYGGLDYLINNVGAVRLHFDGFASITDEDWQHAFDVNLLSAVRAARAALPHLIASRGAIVNVSSMNGRAPEFTAVEYSATKAALNNLSRALAMELAPSGVRVNTVSPGPVRTDMQVGLGGIAEQVAAASGSTIDEYVSDVEKAAPLGRIADPRDVAAVVVMALSERFGYVTGADLHVDGVFPSA
jgi:NAD(P)-dependent dehydrogenase (short-subunit alcohol dehydrogenase family)